MSPVGVGENPNPISIESLDKSMSMWAPSLDTSPTRLPSSMTAAVGFSASAHGHGSQVEDERTMGVDGDVDASVSPSRRAVAAAKEATRRFKLPLPVPYDMGTTDMEKSHTSALRKSAARMKSE